MFRTQYFQCLFCRCRTVRLISCIFQIELKNFPYVSFVIYDKYFSLFHIFSNKLYKVMIFHPFGIPGYNEYFVTVFCNKNLTPS